MEWNVVGVTLVRQEGLHWIWIHWNHNTRPSFIELFSSMSSHFHQSNYSTQLKWWWVAHIGRRAQDYLREGKATTILSAVVFIRCVHFDLMLDSSWTRWCSNIWHACACMAIDVPRIMCIWNGMSWTWLYRTYNYVIYTYIMYIL